MEIELTYQIKVQNNSSNNTITINSIDDYYESSLEFIDAKMGKSSIKDKC